MKNDDSDLLKEMSGLPPDVLEEAEKLIPVEEDVREFEVPIII